MIVNYGPWSEVLAIHYGCQSSLFLVFLEDQMRRKLMLAQEQDLRGTRRRGEEQQGSGFESGEFGFLKDIAEMILLMIKFLC
jgi:hypothetical protein